MLLRAVLFLLMTTFCRTEFVIGGGDIMLHAHVGIYMSSFNNSDCDVFVTDSGIILEALIFAVNKINQDPNIMHGKKFNLDVFDTCADTKLNAYFAVTSNAVAVIGPVGSQLAKYTTSFLSADFFKVSTVSYGATASELANRKKYPYFFRTIPGDSHSMTAIVELSKLYSWSYVGVIYTADLDGQSMLDNFRRIMHVNGMCIAYQYNIKDSIGLMAFKLVIQNAIEQENVKVLFLFLSRKSCYSFFKAAKFYKTKLQKLQIVIGTQCGTMVHLPSTLAPYFEGTLTMQVSDSFPDEFLDYFSSYTYDKGQRNPWIREYWEHVYNCTFDISKDDGSLKNCTRGNHTIYNRLAVVKPVLDAVHITALSVRGYLDNLCMDVSNKNVCFSGALKNGNTLKDLIRSLHKYLSHQLKSEPVSQKLDIYQLLSHNEKFRYEKVGIWNSATWISSYRPFMSNGLHDLNLTTSMCSKPCGPKEIKVTQESSSCCWTCEACPPEYIIFNNTCKSCGEHDLIPNDMKTSCKPLPIEMINPISYLSIIVIAVSCLGLIFSSVIMAMYIRNYQVPLINATNRELALFSLVGLMMMLITPLIYIQRPTDVICGAQKLMFGLSLICVYAPLVLKTNRTYRIFVSSHKFKQQQLALITVKAQFLLVAGMIGIQIIIAVFWILTDLPLVRTTYPKSRDRVVTKCSIVGMSFLLNLIFPVMLMIASTFWAFKTRNLPETFSEIKSIGATMYITLFIVICAMAVTFVFSSSWYFVDFYVLSFAFQLIVFVTLIGQYAQKMKMILLGKSVDINSAQSMNSTVMSNKFALNSRSTTHKHFQDSMFTQQQGMNSFVSRNALGSPRINRLVIEF